MESKTVEFFNKLSFRTLLGTIFLSLFFFIPFVPVTLDASKGFLVSVGVTLSTFFWLIARLGEGKFSIPKDRLILLAAFIPFVFLLSSFFSSSKYASFFGSGFEIGTFGSMLIMFLIFFLSSIYFQSEKRIWNFYIMLFAGGLILAIFELFNMFVGFGRFSPNLLQGISSGNLVGSWNNFALLFGLVLLISVLALEFIKPRKYFYFLQIFLIVVSIFFLAIINIPLVWLLVGIFSVIIFVYSLSTQQQRARMSDNESQSKKFPFVALAVVFICFIFLVSSNSISGFISKYINVSNIDIRPSLTTTSQIAWKAIRYNPFLGTGPNTFVVDWALWQPKAIAQTVFWNVDFANGFSSLLTFAVTTGILGFVSWLAFIGIFFKRVFTSLKVSSQNKLSNYFLMATLVTSIYSWTSFIFYTPNIIIFVLAFASSGILVSILVNRQVVTMKTVSFLNDPRKSFFSILGLMVLMIVTLSTTYLYAEKFASIIYFSKSSVNNATLESLSKSEKMLTNAIALDKNDIYYRNLSQVYIAEIQVLLNDKTISQDILKLNIQRLVNASESSAVLAVNQNPKQYLNYLNLGNIYGALVSLRVDKSYESAISAYDKAMTMAPNNPSLLLARASLEIASKKNDEAKKFIQKALDLKINYTDAIFLLAQIETSEGNTGEAIKQVERAASLTPNDPTVFFRLGLLRYNNSDYTGAVGAFEQAVVLDNNYLNARYFLGQAYQKVGKSSEALVQYNILSKVLPDNQDVKDAINSISNPTTPDATLPNTTTKTISPKPTKAVLPEKQQ